MPTLPHIETAFRDWLAIYHDEYELHLDQIDTFLSLIGLDELPPQVTLPGSIPWTFTEVHPSYNDSYWMAMLFFSTYQQTRHTYHIDEHLWEMLKECRWPAETPAEALAHLPKPAFALSLPDGNIYTVCYDLISGEEGTGDLELRVGRLVQREILPYTILHLRGSIDEGLERALDTILQHFDETKAKYLQMDRYIIEQPEEFRERFRENAEHLVNVLLYLAGEDDIVARVGHYPKKPFKRHQRALEGTQYLETVSRSPSESDVGLAVREAFIRYVEIQGEAGHVSSPTGRSVKPHMRSAHPHLYWTGPGREIPRVRYLKPIPVKGGTAKTPSRQAVQ